MNVSKNIIKNSAYTIIKKKIQNPISSKLTIYFNSIHMNKYKSVGLIQKKYKYLYKILCIILINKTESNLLEYSKFRIRVQFLFLFLGRSADRFSRM
jgi:hypothetical protein